MELGKVAFVQFAKTHKMPQNPNLEFVEMVMSNPNYFKELLPEIRQEFKNNDLGIFAIIHLIFVHRDIEYALNLLKIEENRK